MEISGEILVKNTYKNEVDCLCKKNHYFQKNDMINNILSVNWINDKSNNNGVCLKADNQIVGFIGALNHSYDNRRIVNLSCGIIDESFRGKGHATPFFKFAFTIGDVIIDISPTDQVKKMITKHIPGIVDITDYQLWIRPRHVKSNLRLTYLSPDNISDEWPEFESVFLDNSKYRIKFLKFSNNETNCVVAFYDFNRFFIKGFEIIFCSNKSFLANYLDEIIYLINKKEHAFVCFLDHIFVPDMSFNGNVMPLGSNNKNYVKRIFKLFFSKARYIKTANRRMYVVRDNKPYDFPYGYLYSEVVFYKSNI